jgi:hypothetical protein
MMTPELNKSLLAANAETGGSWDLPAIVAWARTRPATALHNHLEWDDGKAADAYRLGQLRGLIAQVRILIPGTTRSGPIRAVLSLPGTEKDERAYRPRSEVLGDTEKEVILSLRAAHRALMEFKGLGFDRNKPIIDDLLAHIGLLEQQRAQAQKPARVARPVTRPGKRVSTSPPAA